MPNLLVDGPDTALATVLLAHGAGAGMDTAFMTQMAQGLAEKGWQVIRFEFPYMAKQRNSGRRTPPNRVEILLQSFLDQVQSLHTRQPLVIGDKSMGGRIASLIADELFSESRILGCICLGYPFHPPRQAQDTAGGTLVATANPNPDCAGRPRCDGLKERGGKLFTVTAIAVRLDA